VRSIDRTGGKDRILLADKDNTFKPLAGQDSMVVVMVTPTWDSHIATLWGLDAVTGKQQWTYALPKRTSLVVDRGKFDILPTKQGIAMVQIAAEKQVGLDIINVKTGASRSRKLFTTEDEPHDLRIADDGECAWFTVTGDLYSIDLASGKLARHSNQR
jgi:hypothetical protein